MNDTPTVKRPRGRPRKNPIIEREPIKAKPAKMRAAPNWENLDQVASETPDRLHIDPSLIPDGYSLMWAADSIRGQPAPEYRRSFEKGGWTPVYQDDFDGQFNGRFMLKGQDGEINLDGMVLMARPKQLTDAAERREKRKAFEQVAIKEQALTGGELPVTLDAGHKSALATNKINRSYERIEIPED